MAKGGWLTPLVLDEAGMLPRFLKSKKAGQDR